MCDDIQSYAMPFEQFVTLSNKKAIEAIVQRKVDMFQLDGLSLRASVMFGVLMCRANAVLVLVPCVWCIVSMRVCLVSHC